MGNYVYVVYVKWTEAAYKRGWDSITNEWFPKLEEVCTKNNVKILQDGTPFGTSYSHIFIYETEMPLADYENFTQEIRKITEEKMFLYSKTMPVNCRR